MLGKADKSGYSAGGFAGFNTQWDEVILDFDIHYNRSNFFASAPATPISRRTTAGGNVYDVTLNGSADIRIHDWGAARVRAGYVWYNILPYATFGIRSDAPTFRAPRPSTARKIRRRRPPPARRRQPASRSPFPAAKASRIPWIYGWAAGLGADFLILPNLFLRAEYEYVAFTTIDGIKAGINTARIGAALKF